MSKNFSIKFKYFIFLVSFSLLNSVSAQTTTVDYMAAANNTISGAGKLIQNVNTNIGGNLVILLSSVAFVLFLFGLVRFIYDRSSGDDKRLEKDKEAMGWGLVALFVLISVWGIIKMFQGFLGIENSGDINLPKICVNGTCDKTSGAVSNGSVIKTGGDFSSSTKKLEVTNTVKVDGTYSIVSIRNWQNSLKEGMGSPNGTNEIAQLQQFLKDHNYGSYLGTAGAKQDGVDGIFGPNTTVAVKAFQKDNALAQDGIVGQGTKAVILYRYMNAQPDVDKYFVNNWPDIITTGSTDNNSFNTVSDLQRFLSQYYSLGATGPNKDGVDGIYAGKTSQAVVSFQAKFYLKEDNLVGPSTRAVIMFVENGNK